MWVVACILFVFDNGPKFAKKGNRTEQNRTDKMEERPPL